MNLNLNLNIFKHLFKSSELKTKNITHINELPNELFFYLFKYLDLQTIIVCGCICKKWNIIISYLISHMNSDLQSGLEILNLYLNKQYDFHNIKTLKLIDNHFKYNYRPLVIMSDLNLNLNLDSELFKQYLLYNDNYANSLVYKSKSIILYYFINLNSNYDFIYINIISSFIKHINENYSQILDYAYYDNVTTEIKHLIKKLLSKSYKITIIIDNVNIIGCNFNLLVDIHMISRKIKMIIRSCNPRNKVFYQHYNWKIITL